MNKRFVRIIGVLISICFILSLVNIQTKFTTETSSSKVELAVDFKTIYMNSKNGSVEFEKDIHKTIQKNQIKSIGFTENSLQEMEIRELVQVYSGFELRQELWSQEQGISVDNQHTYVLINPGEKQREILSAIKNSQIGEVKEYQIYDSLILDINKRKSEVHKIPLLYLESDYLSLSRNYNIVPRLSNSWGDRFILIEKQLKDWSEKTEISPILFLGTEAVGYEEVKNKEAVDVNKFISTNGFGIVESFSSSDKQKGIETYARASDFNLVRVHSMAGDKLSTMESQEIKRLVAKAINERNIRMVYINAFGLDSNESEEDYLTRLGDSLASISDTVIGEGYEITKSEPFKQNTSEYKNHISQFSALLGVLGLAFLFIYIYIHKLRKWLPLLFGLATVLLSVLYMIDLTSLLIPVASLGLSVLLPLWSSIHIMMTLSQLEQLTFKKIMSKLAIPLLGLYVVGISYLIAMNYTIANVTYIDTFKGVSLTLTVPPLIVGMLVLLGLRGNVPIKKLLFHRLTLVDILVCALLLVFLVYYQSRSGNSGTLLPFEGILRGWLEDVLPWRPRTKEIFFAFPLMVIMIAYWKKSKWIKLMLPFVSVGFASVFNTFTHFHTPMVASIGRTVLSVSIGILIGLLAVLIINFILKIRKS